MLLTASMAVLFETIPGLRGGVGNVIYFFLWTAALALGATGLDDPFATATRVSRDSRDLAAAIDPRVTQQFNFSFTIGGERAVRTFHWDGIHWTVQVLLMRLLVDWCGSSAWRCWRPSSFTASIQRTHGVSAKLEAEIGRSRQQGKTYRLPTRPPARVFISVLSPAVIQGSV